MRGGRGLAWFMLLVWGAWLAGARAWLVSWAGPWAPDLTLVLLVGAVLAFPRKVAPGVVLVLALTRVAHTVDAPVAVLAGFGACLQLARTTHRLFDHGLPWARAAAAGACAWTLASWLVLVRGLRGAAQAGPVFAGEGGERLVVGDPGLLDLCGQALLAGLPTALTTAMVAFLFGPALASLPGLTPLRRRWL